MQDTDQQNDSLVLSNARISNDCEQSDGLSSEIRVYTPKHADGTEIQPLQPVEEPLAPATDLETILTKNDALPASEDTHLDCHNLVTHSSSTPAENDPKSIPPILPVLEYAVPPVNLSQVAELPLLQIPIPEPEPLTLPPSSPLPVNDSSMGPFFPASIPASASATSFDPSITDASMLQDELTDPDETHHVREQPPPTFVDVSPSSSLPPSSSPANIFSSSPLASSQSSLAGPNYEEDDVTEGKSIAFQLDQIPPVQFDDPLPSPSSSLPPSSSPAHILSSSPLTCSERDYKEDDAMEEKSVMVQPEVLEPPLPSSRGETETSAGKTFEEQPHATPPFDQEPRNDGAAFEEEIEVSVGAILGKRTHEETAGPEILEKINTAAEQKTVKRMKMEDPQVHVPPTTKRSTLASQKRQYKKLITPFRSPLVPKTKEQESTSRSEIAETPGFSVAQPPLPITILTPSPQPSSSTSRTHSVQPPNKTVRTQKAASQFKSPLGDSASASSAALPSIRLTPTVQTLERKLQLLKRAVKVRENGEEEVLAGLVKKWTEAGREVAWEVWDLVKDSGGDSGGTNYAAGKKAGFGESWGWDDGGGKKGGNGRDDNWGWDSAEVKREENGHEDQEMSYDSKPNQHGEDGCDEERGRDTLGTMLRQVGIAPETLGWSDDEETFIDH